MKLPVLAMFWVSALTCFGAGEPILDFSFEGGAIPVALAPTPDGGFLASFQGALSRYDRNGKRDPSFHSALDTSPSLPISFIVPDGEGNYFVGPFAVYRGTRYGLAKISATATSLPEGLSLLGGGTIFAYSHSGPAR